MEHVKMRDCGDGFRRADAGSLSPLAVKIAAYTILSPGDAGKTFSNRAATGSVTLTLPAAAEGLFFRIFKPTAQDVVLTATGGANINGVGANGSVTLSASAPASYAVASDGTDWVVNVAASATITEAQLQASSAAGLGVLRVAHARYVYATDGATSPITPSANATIPINAILVGGAINVTAACTGSGVSVAIGTVAGSAANSILAATAVASLGTGVLLPVAPTTTAVKMSAAGAILFTISGGTITAGTVDVFVTYVVASA